MNSRLHQFLEMESLSPTRFCEIMGIQRSGLSHLLSGRNNPSFEFIQKMMTSFPNLNADWLLLGKGKPYKENSQVSGNMEIQGSLFDTETIEPQQTPSEPPENKKKQEQHPTHGKKIDRIIVFFDDGTFEER